MQRLLTAGRSGSGPGARLEEVDEIVANDAYAEFAPPFADLLPLRDDRKFFLQRLEEDKLPDRLRRLYYTLLSVCGEPSDADRLEERLQGEAGGRQGLDALTSCYLSLRGAAGLPLIDRLFLSNPEADSGEQFSVIAALRFQGEEAHFIDRQDLLHRGCCWLPANAERIVPDLADGKIIRFGPQVVKLFEEAGPTPAICEDCCFNTWRPARCRKLPKTSIAARLDPSAARMARRASAADSPRPELGLAPVLRRNLAKPSRSARCQPPGSPATRLRRDVDGVGATVAGNERMLWMTMHCQWRARGRKSLGATQGQVTDAPTAPPT